MAAPMKSAVLPSSAVLLLLAACASPQDDAPAIGVVIPEAYAASDVADDGKPGLIDGQWWQSFGDPQLGAFVEQALADSPSVAAAVARVRQARAQATIAGADSFPQADIGLTATQQELTLESLGIVVPGAGGATSYTIETYNLSANVSWEIDLWGKLSAQSAAAHAQFLGSAENLRAVRQAVAAQVARTYFALVEAREQVRLARLSSEKCAAIAQQITNRVEAGSAQPGDGFVAEANARSANANLAQREEALARLARQLDIMLREYPDGSVVTAAALPPSPAPPDAGVPASLLSRRPDIAASFLDLQAAGYRLEAAERSFLPQIVLTGSAGTSSSAIGNLFDPDYFIWSIAGQLLQPVFQGGRLRAQFDQRAGERDEALQTYADTVLNALAEVETALAVEQFLAVQEVQFAAAASAAHRAEDIARNRYELGADPLLDLLEAQLLTLEAESRLLAVSRARLANRVDLHLALGGGFEQDSGS